MRLLIFILIIFTPLFNLLGQEEQSNFWNPSMQEIAKSNSQKGWVRMKKGLKAEPKTFFEKHGEAFGLKQNDKMDLKSTQSDELGFTHYWFQQKYKGIDIEGCEYILHAKNGQIVSANGKLARQFEQQAEPEIVKAEALKIALKQMESDRFGWEVNEDNPYHASYPDGKLMFSIKESTYGNSIANKEFQLAFRFVVTSAKQKHKVRAIYVNALTGDITKNNDLLQNSHCNCCSGTTQTLYHGTRNITPEHANSNTFQLQDNCRGGGIHTYFNGSIATNSNSNFDNNHDDRVAGSAHWAAKVTYDYFNNVYGRNSFDGNGALIELYSGDNGAQGNAYYDPSNDEFHFGVDGSKPQRWKFIPSIPLPLLSSRRPSSNPSRSRKQRHLRP
jgi:bacillolysin